MSRNFDHLFKLLIIGDSGEFFFWLFYCLFLYIYAPIHKDFIYIYILRLRLASIGFVI